MAGARELGLLLVLLLPLVTTSSPCTVVRLNKAMLSYVSDIGKPHLQRVLQVTVPNFLERSGEELQPTRIQILDVHIPRLQLEFIADFGVHLWAAANFTVKVLSVPNPLELMLPVVLLADARVAQGSIGTPVISISTCSSILGQASVLDTNNSTSPALLVQVQKHLKAVLSSQLCLSVSSLMQDLNVHLGTFIGLNPVGPESQIRYSMINEPTITSDYISLDVSAVLFLLGSPIVLPERGTPFVLPWPVGDRGAMVTVGISQYLFNSTFLLLQKAGSLNLDITGQLDSDDNLLNTSALGQLIPEVARQFSEPMPVVLKVRLGTMPVAMLHVNNITLRLQPFIEVLAVSSNSAFQSLFFLDVVVNLSLQLSVSRAKLQGKTSVLGDIQLSVSTSNVGTINMDKVRTLIDQVFEKPLLDHLNALLSMGIALPSLVNLCYVDSEVFIYEGYIVVSSGLFYPH